MKKQHKLWFESFIQNCKENNKSDYTIINYSCDLKKYIAWFEHNNKYAINKANAATITKYQKFLSHTDEDNKNTNDDKKLKKIVKWRLISNVLVMFKNPFNKNKNNPTISAPSSEILKIKKLAVNSKRRSLSTIKNFYEFLKQSNEDINKLFPLNPVKSKLHNIRLKDEDVIPTKLLTPLDWKALEENIYRPKERLIIHLLYLGGLRLSELSELRVDCFNVSNYSIRFARKGGYVHTLYIQKPKLIFSLLDKYLKSRLIESPFLFCNKKAKHLTPRAMYNHIIKILTKGQVKTYGLTPHSFRKGCASLLYHKTKDLLFVRDYLNHADAKVTQTYIERLDNNSNEKSINT